jgi:hypothetical protein
LAALLGPTLVGHCCQSKFGWNGLPFYLLVFLFFLSSSLLCIVLSYLYKPSCLALLEAIENKQLSDPFPLLFCVRSTLWLLSSPPHMFLPWECGLRTHTHTLSHSLSLSNLYVGNLLHYSGITDGLCSLRVNWSKRCKESLASMRCPVNELCNHLLHDIGR